MPLIHPDGDMKDPLLTKAMQPSFGGADLSSNPSLGKWGGLIPIHTSYSLNPSIVNQQKYRHKALINKC